jgi:hypothetical protein
MCVAPVPLNMRGNELWQEKRRLEHVYDSDFINVPCGKCIECRKTHIAGWVFRLTNEFKAKTTKQAHFLTLTYDDTQFEEEIPLELGGNYTANGELSLNYNHHIQWMKKLRKTYGQSKKSDPIKYFSVGEYGEKTGRPHFHSIIFNADQQNILDTWGRGNVHFGDVTEASINYTLKYCLKRVGRSHDKNYREVETEKLIERALISKGIGIEYAQNPANIKYYNDDIERQITREGGIIQAMPRYYRDKFYTDFAKYKRSNSAQKAIEQKHNPENDRERQARASHAYKTEASKQAQRKIHGND